jgi:hypothetical protein
MGSDDLRVTTYRDAVKRLPPGTEVDVAEVPGLGSPHDKKQNLNGRHRITGDRALQFVDSLIGNTRGGAARRAFDGMRAAPQTTVATARRTGAQSKLEPHHPPSEFSPRVTIEALCEGQDLLRVGTSEDQRAGRGELRPGRSAWGIHWPLLQRREYGHRSLRQYVLGQGFSSDEPHADPRRLREQDFCHYPARGRG